MTSVCGLITWAGIAYTYIRFYNGCKAQGINRADFPYRAPFQPYATYYALVFICLILFFNTWEVFATDQWDTATFVTSYLPIMENLLFSQMPSSSPLTPPPIQIFPFLYAGARFYYKTSHVALAQMDFWTGSRE
ncbi:hypothetical protein RQP46_007095 [Phenoliferia psychrophenolica]